jgi:PAS domain S-box-containing protein
MKEIDKFLNDSISNILVIEDNPGDYALVEEFLFEQKKELNLQHAITFKEAKSILTTEENKIDVILLDLSLPDKVGIELINEIVLISQSTPIIILTGYENLQFGVKSLALGVSDYILKDDLTPQMLYKSILYSAERKKTTIALEESEKRYSDLFHLSPEPMWVYTLDTLMIEDVNEAAIGHYGYTREEFLSMTINELSEHSSEELNLNNFLIPNKLIAALPDTENIKKHRKKNGEVIYVEEHGNGIIYNGKEAKIIFANDVTERINYIDAIESQNKKLRDIAWIQSHVVRAPLARMMGLIDLFKNHNNTSEDDCMIIDYILTCANEIDEVIKNISDKVYDKAAIDNSYFLINSQQKKGLMSN